MKFAPKCIEKEVKMVCPDCPEASRNAFQIQLRFFTVLGYVLPPLGSLWPPFCLPLAAFGLPFGAFWHPLASFGLSWGCLCTPSGPHRQRRRNFAEILPRSCRDSAENVPRTFQEPAENPPYEPQTKLPFALQLLRKDFVRRQTLRQNRLK